jgi:N-acetyl-1-D-myo-inositol-2-amino-2-deoxy-alpha-D-glucopyranoside deacetylase
VEEQMRRLEAAKAEGLSYGLPDVASYVEHRTCPDEAIAAQVDGTPYLETKKAAMAAHETQLEVDGDIYALTNRLAALVLPDECYRLAKGRSGNPSGLEDDLFAGLDG